jgi:L-lactate dehydrogenase complex protein LldG
MSDARERILAHLRESTPTDEEAEPDVPLRRFVWDSGECLARFRTALAAVRGEVHLVDGDWPSAVFELMRVRGATRLCHGPDSSVGRALELAWLAAGGEATGVRLIPYREPVERLRETLFDAVDAGITGCLGAIAETGTLVLWPDAREPRLLSLVPPIHLVLLDAGSIRSTFAELLEEQGWSRGMPTNGLLITGPSKSADIEQTLTYGVHGPKELMVLVRVARERS